MRFEVIDHGHAKHNKFFIEFARKVNEIPIQSFTTYELHTRTRTMAIVDLSF